MNNDIFNFKRFVKYFKTDINNGYSNFGISLLVMSTMAVTIEVFSGLFSLIFQGHWTGSGETVRFIMFLLFLIITIITAPSKLYGNLTDKKEGTHFLMLPASRLEKYVSMLVISCILIPVLYFLIYTFLDLLVTMADPTAGESLISLFSQWESSFTDLCNELKGNSIQFVMSNPEEILTPWLYVDDFIIWPLIFLFGAVLFKKSKISKTIGCYIAISMVLGLVITPFLTKGINFDPETIDQMSNLKPEMFSKMFPGLYWVMNHLVLIDTVSDSIWIVGLLWGIWYKLKNLKH